MKTTEDKRPSVTHCAINLKLIPARLSQPFSKIGDGFDSDVGTYRRQGSRPSLSFPLDSE